MDSPEATPTRWYQEVTAYQWLVLAIASAGWIFDVFEGQIYALTRDQMLAELLNTSDAAGGAKFWGDIFLAVFLIGGAFGGVMFGSLADRFGRKPTMAITILCYSLFSGLTYFATELWHIAALRFLVAMGVGGEWAVAAALVAEVFPPRARAHAAGIFHATSVLGTWLAALAGMWVGSNWRYGYLVGVVPALLVLWVRSSVHEPESWVLRRTGKPPPRQLCRVVRRLALGPLGDVGHSAGGRRAGDVLGRDHRRTEPDQGVAAANRRIGRCRGAERQVRLRHRRDGRRRARAAGLRPAGSSVGRKSAFALMHLGALVIVPVTCYLPQTYTHMLALLPIFGFFTVGIHAGYAIYFPELFPGHLRATGTGVCFNGGRLLAAPLLWISASVKAIPGFDLRMAVSVLSSLFLVGLVVLCFLPETKGRPLPE